MYDVCLATKAGDFYRQADRPLGRKLAGCFRQLETDPAAIRTSNACGVKWRDATGFASAITAWSIASTNKSRRSSCSASHTAATPIDESTDKDDPDFAALYRS